jgi:hypothetical protein
MLETILEAGFYSRGRKHFWELTTVLEYVNQNTGNIFGALGLEAESHLVG